MSVVFWRSISCQVKLQSRFLVFFSGTCNVDTGACECIEEELRAKHSVCIGPAEDNLCSIKCQTMDQAKSGYCGGEHGWDCICEYDDQDNSIDADPKNN